MQWHPLLLRLFTKPWHYYQSWSFSDLREVSIYHLITIIFSLHLISHWKLSNITLKTRQYHVESKVISHWYLSLCRLYLILVDLDRNVMVCKHMQYSVKYNNAKCSIPAHPTFVNDTHRYLHLWTVTPKSIGFTMVNMSAKFDKEAHHGLVCIGFTVFFPYVTLAFDLWPPKSIGSILSLWLSTLPSLRTKYTTV